VLVLFVTAKLLTSVLEDDPRVYRETVYPDGPYAAFHAVNGVELSQVTVLMLCKLLRTPTYPAVPELQATYSEPSWEITTFCGSMLMMWRNLLMNHPFH